MLPSRQDHINAARALSLLRIFLGAVFVVAALGKFTFHSLAGTVPLPVVSATWQVELPARLTTWLAGHPTGVLAAAVRDVLLPNGHFVAGAVAWVQLMAGVCLILGLYARMAAVAAATVAGALAIAAASRNDLDARPYVLLVAIAITVLLGGAGHHMGADGWRRERRRNREL
jgi:uncharacterized membrane protein YphA (DoxX/SURF4 family)